jgi:hypothetical protein
LIQSDEANVDRAAQDHFSRANLVELQFRMDEAPNRLLRGGGEDSGSQWHEAPVKHGQRADGHASPTRPA